MKGALKDAPDLTVEDKEPKAVDECIQQVSNEKEPLFRQVVGTEQKNAKRKKLSS